MAWEGSRRFGERVRPAANVAFVKAGDLLFVLKDDAELIIAKADPSSFTAEKTYQVAEGATWAQPVILQLR